MPYSLTEQYSLDINWYFTDLFSRLCMAASGGGILPSTIAENDEKNDQFHQIILELPQSFEVLRNENIANQIEGLGIQDINSYFKDFEAIASRGFYVYDKLNLLEPENGFYILVAYPIYDTKVNSYPIDRKHLQLIPKIKRAIIARTNETFSRKNFDPLDLIMHLNNSQNKP